MLRLWLWLCFVTYVTISSGQIIAVSSVSNNSRTYNLPAVAPHCNCNKSKSDDNSNNNNNHNNNDVIIIAARFAERSGPLERNECGSGSAVPPQMLLPKVEALSHERYLENTSIIYTLAKMANWTRLSADCYSALRHLEQSILRREPWAMKVLDASGAKPAGFMFGHNFWLGSREACGAATKPLAITLSQHYERNMKHGLLEDVAPFGLDYRVLYLRHNSPWQVEIKLMSERIIHVGLCLPSACRSTEIQELFQQCLQQKRLPDLTDLYDTRAEVLYVKSLKLSESFTQKRSLQLLLTLMAFTCLMMVTASIMNVSALAEEKQEQETQKLSQSAKSLDVVAFFGKAKNFTSCYDVSANWSRLFAMRKHAISEIPIINGLRSVSAIWVMLFHVLWYMYFSVDNKPFMISHAERPFFQYVSSAPLLVDVFFTISGFLQAFNFLRNFQLIENIRRNNFSQNVQKFLTILCHRYLRLAPLYFVIMAVVDLLSAYSQDMSVFHIHDRFDQICSRHWWRNVIFVQNLFDHEEMCVNWTWSLACEMQFFILATVSLFIYVKHPSFTKVLLCSALAATIGWSYISGMAANFQLSFDVTFATGTQIYINPFVRILPYLLGALTGWFLVEHRPALKLSALREKCLWNLTIVTFFSCIYSTFRRDISSLSSISLFVFGRLFFSCAVCWMIVGSATGRSTWWSRILEAPLFQHFNRLTYAFYLLNPLIIALFFSLSETSTRVDPLMLCVLASGFMVIVYIASIGFSLAFEMPYCNWSSLMLQRDKTKRKVA